MSAPTVIEFKKFAGIRNAQDRSQISPPYLWEGDNADLDDSGILSRRGGFGTATVAGDFRDGWTSRDEAISLAVQDGTKLVVVGTAGAITVLRSDLIPGLPMDYVDADDKVFYANYQVLGIADKATASLQSFSAITAQLSIAMPGGQFIEHFNSRIYVARGNTLYPSAPLDYGRIEERKSIIPFPKPITLLKAVADGLWVAAGSTYFLAGSRPKDFVLREAADYDARPYTASHVDAALLFGTEAQGDAVMWESEKGTCIGLAGGKLINIALNGYNPQTAVAGRSIIRQNRKGTYQYLALTHA